jgi:hypothetical protein
MSAQSSTPTKKSRRGCIGCIGCLGLIALMLIVCGGSWFLGPSLLRSLGLLPPDPVELYSGAADPVATDAVETILVDAGFEGANAVVLPTKGRNKQLAVIMLDSSSKVKDTGENATEEALMKLFRGLADADPNFNLERMVTAFLDENGDPIVAITAPQHAVDDFANGRISRGEFLRNVDADFSSLLNAERLQTLARRERLPLPEVDAEFVAGLAAEWAVAKEIVSTNCPAPYNGQGCDFSFNPAEIARHRASQHPVAGIGLGVIGARTTEPEAAAALGAASVAAGLTKAKNLADEGLKEGSLEKIDRAIAMRPDDWSFRERRAAFLLSEGRDDDAGRATRQSESLVDEHIRSGGDCKSLQLNLLQNRRQALSQASEQNPNNRTLRDQIDITEGQVAAVQDDTEDSPCR